MVDSVQRPRLLPLVFEVSCVVLHGIERSGDHGPANFGEYRCVSRAGRRTRQDRISLDRHQAGPSGIQSLITPAAMGRDARMNRYELPLRLRFEMTEDLFVVSEKEALLGVSSITPPV